jgi:hypothetical protein
MTLGHKIDMIKRYDAKTLSLIETFEIISYLIRDSKVFVYSIN